MISFTFTITATTIITNIIIVLEPLFKPASLRILIHKGGLGLEEIVQGGQWSGA